MAISDYIILGIFLLIVALVIFFVIKEKKKGKVCIGCPYAGSCNKSNCHK